MEKQKTSKEKKLLPKQRTFIPTITKMERFANYDRINIYFKSKVDGSEQFLQIGFKEALELIANLSKMILGHLITWKQSKEYL